MSRPGTLSERRDRLVRNLLASGYIRSPAVEKAMRAVPREKFLPKEMEEEAYTDSPMPIGMGQTISAPHMVAIMEEELELSAGLKVLEIGAGSGYHAAVTAEIVGPTGKVLTIERIPELVKLARSNLQDAGYAGNIEVILGDGSKGLVREAPFDRIFVAAGAPEVPKPLVDQLGEDGIMLVPVGSRMMQDLIKIRKRHGKISQENKGGVIFVPLIGEHGHR